MGRNKKYREYSLAFCLTQFKREPYAEREYHLRDYKSNNRH